MSDATRLTEKRDEEGWSEGRRGEETQRNGDWTVAYRTGSGEC